MKKISLFLESLFILCLTISCTIDSNTKSESKVVKKTDTKNVIINVNDNDYFVDERTGIIISFDTNLYTPSSWNIHKDMVKSNKEHYVEIIKKALSNYSIGILKNIDHIYIYNSLSAKGLVIGGTVYEGSVIMTTNTDYFMDKIFNHELSHILYEKYKDSFPMDIWLSNTRMEYGSSGIDAIKEGESDYNTDQSYFQYGIITQYGSSCFEEDFATFAENIFCPFNKDYIKNNELLRNKYNLVVEFYKNIDPQLNISSI